MFLLMIKLMEISILIKWYECLVRCLIGGSEGMEVILSHDPMRRESHTSLSWDDKGS